MITEYITNLKSASKKKINNISTQARVTQP